MTLMRCSFPASLSVGLRHLRDGRRGTIAVTTALCATVLCGFAGLALDVASWEVAQRSMQGVADAAAYSAAVAYGKSGATFAQAQTQAKAIAAQQGYAGACSATVSGTTVSVCVNQPPATVNTCAGNTPNTYSGSGAATAIQVVICQPQPRFFSNLFLSTNPTVKASAVAAAIGGTGGVCILALSPNANPGITISGGMTNVNAPGCVMASDSNGTSGNGSVNISGGATATTACLVAVGADVITGNSTLNLTQCTTATNGAASVADPFASVPQPTQPGTAGQCTGTPLVCTPGYYSQQLNVNVSVTFQSGLYYFGKGFQVSGGTATGTDVIFFIATGQTAAVSGNATVTFSAPTAANCITSTCPYVGIVFFGSRQSNNGNNNFSGSVTMSIAGAVYFPTQQVSFSGSSSTVFSNSCPQIVASTVVISGQAQLSDSCNSSLTNIADGAPGQVQLVE